MSASLVPHVPVAGWLASSKRPAVSNATVGTPAATALWSEVPFPQF